MLNFSYPLKDALQELIWDFQNIGQEFIQDMQALEPEVKSTIDDIEEKYPDEPLDDAIFKYMIDTITNTYEQKENQD
ncbi:hypothetical protein [Hydrogenovibrio halophilus]|uniref:hypothetical protein n=1 Tax=Hydrogenovibrio halophilus TaxID=373391 RepID=UPI0003710964|nr:hypothetical protein [Hydrogenovibrio halophilus]